MPILRRFNKRKWQEIFVELALIFVGITAALWFDAAIAERQERRLEASILREMAQTLASDTADLHSNVVGTTAILASIDTILAYFGDTSKYDGALDEHFARVANTFGMFHNRAAYEYLRSSGLGVISSDSLRQRIVRYYDFQVPALLTFEELKVHPYRQDFVLPQIVKKFVIQDFAQRLKPLEYSSLRTDQEFQNILQGAKGPLSYQALLTADALQSATALIDEIASELSRD